MASENSGRNAENQPILKKRSQAKYTKRLTEIDNRVSDFIQQVTRETTRAYRTTVSLHKASYIMPLLFLLTGLYLILFDSDNNVELLSVASVCIISGLIALIYLQSRNPAKNVRYLVNNLMKLNVLFSGYIRQIYQVDAVFEDMIERNNEIDPEVAEQMLNHLQDAMAEAMSAISLASNTFDE
jgi:hypothetical protein